MTLYDKYLHCIYITCTRVIDITIIIKTKTQKEPQRKITSTWKKIESSNSIYNIHGFHWYIKCICG